MILFRDIAGYFPHCYHNFISVALPGLYVFLQNRILPMRLHYFFTLINFNSHGAMLSRADTEITQSSTTVQCPLEVKRGI